MVFGAVTLAGSGLAGAGVPAPTQESVPAQAAAPQASADGSVAPAGANIWDCRPSAQHPRPVVLVHGTWDNQNHWDVLAPGLAAQGYCVFTLNYGQDTSSVLGAKPGTYATGDIPTSAREVGAFVDRVLTSTGAAQVDMVGHSQGGLVAREYLKFDGGADPADPSRNKIKRLVTIAATNHGTTVSGAGNLVNQFPQIGEPAESVVGKASIQQIVGSPVVTAVNADGDTMPGIDYTVVATHVDTTSTPPEATFLTAGPDSTVRNVWVQDQCAADATEHGDLPFSPTVGYIVKSALDPAYTGDPCTDK